jgi:putative NIF3 family GTP cyclohydrolase 1 type 2
MRYAPEEPEGTMERLRISRRRFVEITGAAAASTVTLRGADAPSAQEFVASVAAALGGEPLADSIDGFKAGDPGIAVKGVATTAMATMAVLRQAANAGTNLIFSYEPTFFGRQDGPSPPPPPEGRPAGFRGLGEDDPVYRAKKAFIEENGLVVYRLRDQWQARKGPEMTAGLADALGWSAYRVQADDALYEIPAASAEQVVALLRDKLNIRGGLRAVGDRTAQVRRVLLYPGFTAPATMWARYGEADLLITGEVREWENTFYAADLFTVGEKRGLVTLGRVVSEDPGMRRCAGWLKTIAGDLPTRWISAGDLYWRAS